MINFKTGNLLESDTEALVNTVNCVGVMGKGIALQFKQAFPDNFKKYETACRSKTVRPGKMFIVSTNSFINPKYIINFPTKRHWKGQSKMEDIELGLKDLVLEVERLGIQSIAIPPLGCGNGGLDWNQIRPKIVKAFEKLPQVDVYLYGQAGSPLPDNVVIGTNRPQLTRARALFIALMKEYAVPGYRLSLLEIQKLAYFLQELGEPLKLNFVGHKYGPYADNLNHVLQKLEGHYIRGYGDRSSVAQVYLLPDAAEEADQFLADKRDSIERLEEVKQIIWGFESPYGLELLSTVHWVLKNNPGTESSSQEVVRLVHEWNERKKNLFCEDHIVKAWKHLKGSCLLN